MMMGNVCALFFINTNVITSTDFWKLLILYILSYPIRAVSMIPFFNIMKKNGDGMSNKKLLILVLANEKTIIWLFVYHLTSDVS